MTRSSRHKHRKEEKSSYKDDDKGLLSETEEEDRGMKSRRDGGGGGGEEVGIRVSRDSVSGEKRKLASSRSRDYKDDVFRPDDDVVVDEYVASKRRKDRVDSVITDRWNGSEEDRGKRDSRGGEVFMSDSGKQPLKMKSLVDTNSNSKRRHESLTDTRHDNVGVTLEREEVKRSGSGKSEAKRKAEKDLRKEVSHYSKDVKDKDRESERDRKIQDGKNERSGGSDRDRKRGSQLGSLEEEGRPKKELENTEWQRREQCNPNLEKEVDNRTKRRDRPGDNDKYQDDIRRTDNKGLSSKDDRDRSGRDRDGRSDRDKYRDDKYRNNFREEINRDHIDRDEKRRDECSSRNHRSDRPEQTHLRDDDKTADYGHKKSKQQDIDRDFSPHRDDRGTRYKDDRGKKSSFKEIESHNDRYPLSTSEHRSDMERKLYSSYDKGKSELRHVDGDSNVSSSKRKTSPSSGAYVTKDQYRNSPKQTETQHRGSMFKEKVDLNIACSREVSGFSGAHERATESRSMERHTQKDDTRLRELPNERSRKSGSRASPMHLERSPSPSSVERRYSNRSSLRRSLDREEKGGRYSGSKDVRDFSANAGRKGWDLPAGKPSADKSFQADVDGLSMPSPFSRTSHLPSNSSSHLPPHTPRSGVGSPSAVVSFEEESRGKPNRYRRSSDPNVGRGLGNAWNGIPNWPLPLPNGFIPYPHGPPPGGHHPMMQPFPAHLFGVRPPMELNHTGVPYHMSEADRFSGQGHPFGWRNPADGAFHPHMHGWDGNNGVFGDESQMYRMPGWDQNRHLMNGRGWEMSAEKWKGQTGGKTVEFPPTAQKDHHLQRDPAEEPWTGQPGQRPRNERERPSSQTENVEIKQLSSAPLEKDSADFTVIHEKRSESFETSKDDGARYCNAYLSKLDISVDLTRPQLYNQYMSLLGDGDATSDGDATKNLDLEEPTEAGVKISQICLGSSLFPKISNSIYQSAMALYKKQAGETNAVLRTLSSPKSRAEILPTTDEEEPDAVETSTEVMPNAGLSSACETLEPVSAPEEEIANDPILTPIMEMPVEVERTSNQGTVEEPKPASDQEKEEELLPTSNQEKAVIPLPTSNLEMSEESIRASDEEMVEHIPTSEQEIAEEPKVASDWEMVVEPISTADQEVAEDPELTSDQKMLVETIPTSGQEAAEELKPSSDQEMVELPTADQEVAKELESTSDQEMVVETISTSGREVAEQPKPTSDQELVELPTTAHKVVEEPESIPDQEMVVETKSILDQEVAEELIPISDQEVVVEPIPTSDDEVVAEPPEQTSDQEITVEPVRTPDQERMEEPISIPTPSHELPEEAVSAFNQGKAEEESSSVHLVQAEGTLAHGQIEHPTAVPVEEETQEPDPTSIQSLTSNLEKMEGAVEECSLAATGSLSNEEDISTSDIKGSHTANSIEEQKVTFGDTVCGSVGLSEGCEALVPESVDYGLVNLSRIHQFSESTH